MKQFIVDRHTTPSTPTLEQVPTEKIPIYDDIDAAAADLDYLTEGQIVATKDTGDELSNPVDAVESGNLHAVTSNEVASKFTYFKVRNVTKNTGNKAYYTITEFFPDVENNYILVSGFGTSNAGNLQIDATTTESVDTSMSNLIAISKKNTAFSQNTDYTLSFDIFAIKKDLFQEKTE